MWISESNLDYNNSIVAIEMVLTEEGLYFGLRILAPFHFLTHRFISQWTYKAILTSSAAMLIALARPYKTTYMNVLDSLVLATFAINCHLLSVSPKCPTIRAIEVFIITLIPGIIFWLFIVTKLVTKPWKRVRNLASSKLRWFNTAKYSWQAQLFTHPTCTSTTVTIADVCSYGSINIPHR
jgi:hypothetical protein